MRTVDILKEMFRGDTETFEVYQHRRRGIRASKMVFDRDTNTLPTDSISITNQRLSVVTTPAIMPLKLLCLHGWGTNTKVSQMHCMAEACGTHLCVIDLAVPVKYVLQCLRMDQSA